jgi:hypothetical protein
MHAASLPPVTHTSRFKTRDTKVPPEEKPFTNPQDSACGWLRRMT